MTQTSLKSLVPKQELDPSFSGHHLFWWPAATDTQRCDCRCLGAFGALPAGTDPRAAARQSAQGVGVERSGGSGGSGSARGEGMKRRSWDWIARAGRSMKKLRIRFLVLLQKRWLLICSVIKKTITLLHDASCSVGSDFQMIFGWEVAEGPNFVVDTAWPCFAAESTIWNTTWKLGKVDSEEACWYYYFNIIR